MKLNKDLTIFEKYSEKIRFAEKGRYCYFYFPKGKIQDIANLNNEEELTQNIAFTLAQALFPEYLICSGLFDSFLMFEIKDCARVDPPKYFYNHFGCFLNNKKDVKENHLGLEIKDLFKKNNIKYSSLWKSLFEHWENEVQA